MVKRALVHIDEGKCDGCGQCVSRCAEGAITLVNGKAKLVNERYCDGLGACLGICPRDAIKVTEAEAQPFDGEAAKEHKNATSQRESRLRNWPVQLNLVSPKAHFLEGSSLLLMADCVPVAHPDWQGDLLDEGVVVLLGCPKFDDAQRYAEKLGEILSLNSLKEAILVHMEVPCCSGLDWIFKEAMRRSGKIVQFKTRVLGIDGQFIG